MDPTLQFLYRERVPLDASAPRVIRARVAGFAPVLGAALEEVRLAASEVASAFLRHGRAQTFEFRIYLGSDRVRVEMVDSMLSEQNLTVPYDEEGELRRSILDGTTDRWGVLGDGVSIIWFEVHTIGAEREAGTERREMT